MQVERAARDAGGPHAVALIQDMELWQIAELFAMNETDQPRREDGSPVPSRRGGRDLVAERMRAHREGLPEPEPDANSGFAAQMFAEQFAQLAAQ